MLPTFRVAAQASTSVGTTTPTVTATATFGDNQYSVVTRGGNHRVWQSVVAETDLSGQTTYCANIFTEIATGLHFWSNGQWLDANENISITASGAAAMNCQHQVNFASNLHTQGSIDVLTPDGQHLTSSILGLSYFDTSSGQNVIIAEIQDSTGQLLQTSNQAIYTNALFDADTGFGVDVRYSNQKNGMEQDVILRSQPPLPETFNLNPRTTHLQIWTEFFNPPEPVATSGSLPAPTNGQEQQTLTDQELNFGIMHIGLGNAFSMGNTNEDSALVPVAKQWVHQDGRTFLIEEVLLDSVTDQISTLPLSFPSTNTVPGGTVPGHALHRKMPIEQLQASKVNPLPMQIASLDLKSRPGLLLDYQMINGNLNNYIFQADTTYYVSGPLNLYSNVTIEGGAVIKCAPTASGTVVETGEVNWLTSAYRPAFFTATNDNSVGVSLAPSNAAPVISVTSSLYLANGGKVSNVRFSYIKNAFSGLAGDMEVTDCQFVYCTKPITVNTTTTNLGLHNVLIVMGNTNYSGGNAIQFYSTNLTLSGEHVTADLGPVPFTLFKSNQLGSFSLTNSVIQSSNLVFCSDCSLPNTPPPVFSTNCVYYSPTPSSTIFHATGAGNYYLKDASVCRNAGTTNINPVVLADIRSRTTTEPIYLTNTYTSDTTLTVVAPRDTLAHPDLGYHYAPLDYLISSSITNATLTLTNGVALGFYNGSGIWLRDGSHLISQGTPTQQNYLVHYSYVQEQATNLWPGTIWSYALQNALPILPAPNAVASRPMVSLRLTTLEAPQTANYVFNTQDTVDCISALTLQDCEIYAAGATWSMAETTNAYSATLKNNLFHRANVMLATHAQINAFNNTFFGSNNLHATFTHTGTGVSSNTNMDNAYDGVNVSLDGTFGYNAYLNGAISGSGTNATDIVRSNFTWQAGMLGLFYQASNSSLLSKGSATADFLGLYNYTVLTNQTIEGFKTVSLGYHYVGLDGSGKPLDTDTDGIPDYLESPTGPTIPAAWLTLHFGAGYAGNPSAAAGADPDGDGLINLQEFYFGSDPLVSQGTAIWVGNPAGFFGIP